MSKFKIYTKGGDKGQTSLIGGKRVHKSDFQVEAYGSVDEAKSLIAVLHDMIGNAETKASLSVIIERLFVVESSLASATEEDRHKMPKIDDSDILFLESEIDRMDFELDELKAFILPGGNLTASTAHFARTVCRRSERSIIRFMDEKPELYCQQTIKYVNRLSDYLFTLARYITKQDGSGDILWLPQK